MVYLEFFIGCYLDDDDGDDERWSRIEISLCEVSSGSGKGTPYTFVIICPSSCYINRNDQEQKIEILNIFIFISPFLCIFLFLRNEFSWAVV